jgi:hypothetical protein
MNLRVSKNVVQMLRLALGPARHRKLGSSLLVLAAAGPAVIGFVSCGGSSSTMMTAQTGNIKVTLTDPPSCKFPNGDFEHVYVTIRSVQANISATADDSSSGWQELAPQLNSAPMQIDLFSTASNTCLLTNLGSNSALPAGTYQQIRLLLVPNDGSGGATPSTNACASNGYNCVVLHNGTVAELQLSSQANTGLKIPPGQVQGGPITVAPGQDVDLNIDFNACASILKEGNGRFRLKPVLTAEQVGTNTTGISGTIVDIGTKAPISNAIVLVALESKDASGADVIFLQKTVDSSGVFNFCRHLPYHRWRHLQCHNLAERPGRNESRKHSVAGGDRTEHGSCNSARRHNSRQRREPRHNRRRGDCAAAGYRRRRSDATGCDSRFPRLND